MAVGETDYREIPDWSLEPQAVYGCGAGHTEAGDGSLGARHRSRVVWALLREDQLTAGNSPKFKSQLAEAHYQESPSSIPPSPQSSTFGAEFGNTVVEMLCIKEWVTVLQRFHCAVGTSSLFSAPMCKTEITCTVGNLCQEPRTQFKETRPSRQKTNTFVRT